MKKGLFAFFLILLIGSGGIALWYYLKPKLFERKQLTTSDAPENSFKIRIGGDNYLGYWFITSPEMRKASREGIQVDFTDDGGAYVERLKKFANNEYDAIVLPVNSYLQHGSHHKFPGVIVVSISESKGADGITGFAGKLPTGKISDLNNPNLKVVYTSESPSSFLLDLTIADFDLFQLQANKNWRVEVGSSKEVYERAKKKNGDVFVLWEPDLSEALKIPGMTYIWGSDKFSGYIVDVFVFRRDFVESKMDVLIRFFKTYFRVMAIYANNRDRMLEEMGKSTGSGKDQVEEMLKKIDWFDLRENASLQFGISAGEGKLSQDGLINTIIACTDVMIRTGKTKTDPLEGNYYLITNSDIIEELSKNQVLPTVGQDVGPINFASLDREGWKKLRDVGTVRVEPISFQIGENLLPVEGKEQADKIAQLLVNNYPAYRVAIRGHTAPGENEAENEKLSLQRAQAVTQYLIAVHNIDPDRLKAEGLGSKSPPPQRPDESPRAYRYRLPRVEFVLFEANPL